MLAWWTKAEAHWFFLTIVCEEWFTVLPWCTKYRRAQVQMIQQIQAANQTCAFAVINLNREEVHATHIRRLRAQFFFAIGQFGWNRYKLQ